MGAGAARRRAVAQGENDRDRRDHARGERGDAQHRAARHRGKLSGVLTGLAKTSGIETPTRDDLARLDRKRKKKTSNKDWRNPHDPDAKVATMKDGRTHLAHKAEHAVDLETGAIVAVTLQGADAGDTTTIVETATAAADQIADAQVDVAEPQTLEEIIADKGYHSNQTMIDLDAVGVRSYIAEPDRGRRDWS